MDSLTADRPLSNVRGNPRLTGVWVGAASRAGGRQLKRPHTHVRVRPSARRVRDVARSHAVKEHQGGGPLRMRFGPAGPRSVGKKREGDVGKLYVRPERTQTKLWISRVLLRLRTSRRRRRT